VSACLCLCVCVCVCVCVPEPEVVDAYLESYIYMRLFIYSLSSLACDSESEC
jgi:hypothetical protein